MYKTFWWAPDRTAYAVAIETDVKKGGEDFIFVINIFVAIYENKCINKIWDTKLNWHHNIDCSNH